MDKKPSVIIIGAGFAGLSAAALLSNEGYRVTVLEKNSSVGGRAQVLRKKGFTFDMGPSWYLMPDVFESFFNKLGYKVNKLLDLKRLDPSYRIFFEQDDQIDISPDLNKNLKLFESLEVGSAKKFKEFLNISHKLYELSKKHFLYKEFKSLKDFIVKDVFKEAKGLYIFDSMDKYVSRFFKSDKLRKILLYSIVFLGGAPKITPSLYALLTHVDFNLGVWYPMGGMGKVVEEIKKIALKNKVKIILNCNVKSIIIENKIAKALQTSKKNYSADIIISAADLAFTETKLLESQYQTYPQKYWDSKTIAPSAFVIYLGLNKKIKNLMHHNLILVNDWTRHFDTIFKTAVWPDKPSYYVCAPSMTDPSVAPIGKENLFILVPIAAGLKDNSLIRKKYYQKIIKDLEQTINEPILQAVEFSQVFSINDYKQNYNAFKGTALGLTHTFFQSALFRPGHKSKKVNNLFYTGQFSTPGVGVPMTLISSQVLLEEIKKQYA